MPSITDWLMVVITLVYVVATIFICSANIKSAKATRDQLAESKRQFEEQNRAFITYEFIYENRVFYGLRFTNHGKRVAEHVKLLVDNAFINSLSDPHFKKSLLRLDGKEFSLGIEQSYDIFFGSQEFRENSEKLPIKGTILYSDFASKYQEDFLIDFNDYPPIFTVESDSEKLRDELKNQTKELCRIRDELRIFRRTLDENKDMSQQA